MRIDRSTIAPEGRNTRRKVISLRCRSSACAVASTISTESACAPTGCTMSSEVSATTPNQLMAMPTIGARTISVMTTHFTRRARRSGHGRITKRSTIR